MSSRTSSATTTWARAACSRSPPAAGSGSARSTPPRWQDTTRAAQSSYCPCWPITCSPGAARRAGRPGRPGRGAHPPPGHPARARPAARHPGRAADAGPAHRADRPGHRRAVADPRAAAGRHRPPLFRRRRPGGARPGGGAADGHRRPAWRGGRAVRPGPARARTPHRQLMTTSAHHPARDTRPRDPKPDHQPRWRTAPVRRRTRDERGRGDPPTPADSRRTNQCRRSEAAPTASSPESESPCPELFDLAASPQL
jgi:hypothetical protein